jgi:imidazolonepropionase-like amidohydrolase
MIVNLILSKSDHPVLNSRYLVYEAQQAHYYGLPDNLALAAVTSTPATVMGQDHRIGFIKLGTTMLSLTNTLSSES